jgi:hypothetical protein
MATLYQLSYDGNADNNNKVWLDILVLFTNKTSWLANKPYWIAKKTQNRYTLATYFKGSK